LAAVIKGASRELQAVEELTLALPRPIRPLRTGSSLRGLCARLQSDRNQGGKNDGLRKALGTLGREGYDIPTIVRVLDLTCNYMEHQAPHRKNMALDAQFSRTTLGAGHRSTFG